MKILFGELEDLFFNINDIINFFEGTKYENRRFKLHLSNGEHLNFCVPRSSIPHLLGINTSYLTSTGIFKETNSFELLKKLVSEPFRIHELQKNKIIDYDQLFSPYIFDKVNHFKENIKINIENVDFICKYNSEKTYVLSKNFQKYNYIIVKRLANEKIGMLCLVRNQGFYAPMSNQIFENFESAKEKLKELVKHQEITLISGIETHNIYTDYQNSVNLNLQQKGKKLHYLRDYKEEFEATIDVAKDFEYSIGRLQQHRTNFDENSMIIDEIVACIKENKIIKSDSYSSSTLTPIIEAFNDFICSNDFTENTNNQATYSSLIKKLKKFEEKIKTLENENQNLSMQVDGLTTENGTLKEKNEKHEENEEAILKILKPRM